MLVRDVMSTGMEFVAPETTAMMAAKIMRDNDIGILPVLDGGNVVGMLTDRDMTVRILAEGLDGRRLTVEEVMTPDLLTCSQDDTVEDAAELMADRQIRRLVVLGQDGKAVGIVSLGDLALNEEEAASEALSGISEMRHDEPGTELNH